MKKLVSEMLLSLVLLLVLWRYSISQPVRGVQVSFLYTESSLSNPHKIGMAITLLVVEKHQTLQNIVD